MFSTAEKVLIDTWIGGQIERCKHTRPTFTLVVCYVSKTANLGGGGICDEVHGLNFSSAVYVQLTSMQNSVCVYRKRVQLLWEGSYCRERVVRLRGNIFA